MKPSLSRGYACKTELHNTSGYFDNVEDSGTMAETALHALFSGIADVYQPADFAKYIEPDNDDCNHHESVFLYVGLFAETD